MLSRNPWAATTMAVLLLFILLLPGCAGHVAYDTLSMHLSKDDCESATALMAASVEDYGDNGSLLFLLDSAMVNMRCQNFHTAQEQFRAAEDLAESLWTLSVSRELASLLANDYLLEYRGEDFERAMIHLMSALAFLDSREPGEALVECRRLDSLFALLNDRYEGENVYKEDAFARYLSGILREGDHDPDGAFIDYKKAIETYADSGKYYQVSAPDSLKDDLFRVARLSGRLADAQAVFPGYSDKVSQGEGMGQVVFIQLQGRVPQKEEDRIFIPTKHGTLTIAFPRFVPSQQPGPGHTLVLRPETGEPVRIETSLVSDIGAIAVKDLEDRRIRITVKAIARAAAKQVAIRQAAKQAGKNKDKEVQQAVETALNLLNALFEHADLRSWQSLPGQIYMARKFLLPGSYHVQAEGIQKKVLVKAGQIHYIVVNDFLGSNNQ